MKRYAVELGLALASYTLLMLASIWVLQHSKPPSPLREMLALAPMLGCSGLCWVMLRALRRLDELQRRIQLEALGFAFAGTALISFSYGFLESLDYPRQSMFMVWPLMAALWCVGLALARRRYA